MSIQTALGRTLTRKKLGVGGVLGLGFNVFSFADDYKRSRSEGDGKAGALAKASGNAVMFEAIGWKGMLGLGALKAAPSLAVGGLMKAGSMARSMDRTARNVPFANSTFTDNKQSYTMRQAGMQLAQASKYNLQQSLMGNEAAAMHRL